MFVFKKPDMPFNILSMKFMDQTMYPVPCKNNNYVPPAPCKKCDLEKSPYIQKCNFKNYIYKLSHKTNTFISHLLVQDKRARIGAPP